MIGWLEYISDNHPLAIKTAAGEISKSFEEARNV